jgi:hypothetical protein
MRQVTYPAAMMLLFASFFPPLAAGQEGPQIRAKMWAYGSLCSFTDPPHSSGFTVKYTTDKVTMEVTDCKTLEKKHSHPSAVCVSLSNNGQTPIEVPIEKDLAGVVLSTREGKTTPALAKRAMVEGPMGGTKMEFVTRGDASYQIKLEGGQEVNIVYLFSEAKAGDAIKIGTLKPAKIE